MKPFITKNLGQYFNNKPEAEKKHNPTPKITSGKQITLTPDLFNRKAFPETQISKDKEKVFSAEEVAEIIRSEARKSEEFRRNRGR